MESEEFRCVQDSEPQTEASCHLVPNSVVVTLLHKINKKIKELQYWTHVVRNFYFDRTKICSKTMQLNAHVTNLF